MLFDIDKIAECPDFMKCPQPEPLQWGAPIALAMMYVPVQEWQDIYEQDTALERGTLFAQLDKPFYGRSCSK